MVGLKEYLLEEPVSEVLEGVIQYVKYDLILGDYTAWLDYEEKKVAIPRGYLELYEVKGNLNAYIGKPIQFSIVEYNEYRDIYIGSCKQAKLLRQQHILAELKRGEPFEAVIIKNVYFGAYLSIDSLPVILRNKDFSLDYTTVGDIFKRGDKLTVKLHRISQNGKVNVEAVPKYKNPHRADLEEFTPQTMVQGIVRNVKSWAVFVNIAPNLDAICPVPGQFQIEEGMKVAFRINQVRPEEGRIRGKIIKVLD